MKPSLSPTRRVRLGVLFFLCLALPRVDAQPGGPTPTPTPSLSGCQVCATNNDCSRAYFGGPGKHCGAWEDPETRTTQRCCCPRDAACAVTNDDCRCSLKDATPAPAPDPAPQTLSTGAWIGVGAGAAAFLSCALGLCWCTVRAATRQRRQSRGHATAQPITSAAPRGVPMAVPAYSAAPGRPQPRAVYAPESGGDVYYAYTAVPSAPAYDYGNSDGYDAHHHHHHHYTGVSAGVGAAAGIATGMVVADIVSDGGYHYGGGYDAGADSGGYSGGYDGGGGDSGGGGGDCGGDS